MNQNDYTGNKSSNFVLVWKECGKDKALSERFFVSGYKGYLPFLLWGDDKIALENKKNVKMTEERLLFGILYGLNGYEKFSKTWHCEEDKKTLLYLLDLLQKGFKFESLEVMILSVSSKLRENIGNNVSRIILEVGNNLVSKSSKIKSDLVCDLWEVAVIDDDKKNEILEEIVLLVNQIDFSDIHPGSKQVLGYYVICSIILLDRNEDLTDYLEEYVYPHVTAGILKNNIHNLLENHDGYSMTDLKIS